MSELDEYLKIKKQSEELRLKLEKLEGSEEVKKSSALLDAIEVAITDSGLDRDKAVDLIVRKYKSLKKSTMVNIDVDGVEYEVSARGATKPEIAQLLKKYELSSKAELIERFKA